MTGSNWDFKYSNQPDKAHCLKNVSTTSLRENNKKITDGLSACRKADVDCILMANIFGEVLRFTFFCVPYGEKQHTQTRTSTSKGKAHLKI